MDAHVTLHERVGWLGVHVNTPLRKPAKSLLPSDGPNDGEGPDRESLALGNCRVFVRDRESLDWLCARVGTRMDGCGGTGHREMFTRMERESPRRRLLSPEQMSEKVRLAVALMSASEL